MKTSLSKRLTYRIMTVVLVMMAVIAGVVYFTVRKYMLNEAKERYQNVLLERRQELRRRLSDVYVAAENNVHDIERDLDNPDKMFAHVERIVKNNATIICCGLLFEPDYFPDKGQFFVPYATRDSDDQIRVTRIDNIYQSYIDEDWYKKRMKKDKSGWTEAYFENLELTNNKEQRLLTTYAVPIHDGKAQHPVALLCCDLSLEWLRTTMMENVIVFDGKGTYIIHPDKERMLRDTLAIKDIIKGNKGSAMVTIDGVKSWIYYRHVKHTDWTMAIVVPENDILSNARGLNHIILLAMIIGLLAIYLFCRHRIKEIADPIAIQKATVERELQIAHNIQMAMLPKTFSPFPDRNDINIFAELTPAKAVGGDLYDFFIRDEKLFFCIGDVSGKGVPAALVMAMACSAFRLLAESENGPESIVGRMNDAMARNNDMNLFVTLFVGVLDMDTGRLRYCNAGHCAPCVDSQPLQVDPNLPVGVMPGWAFTVQETILTPGSMLFLYTDGLTEAEDIHHNLFGEERMKEALIQKNAHTPQTMIEQMATAVNTFVGEAEQSDDLTMLAIQYT